MGGPIIVDCSVTMGWVFEDQASPLADRVLDRLEHTRALVPAVWPLEVLNVLLVAERARRLARTDSTRFLGLLQQLPIRIEPPPDGAAMGEILSLARDSGLSSYDASYLHLAMRKAAPLATLDKALRRAARKWKVPTA